MKQRRIRPVQFFVRSDLRLVLFRQEFPSPGYFEDFLQTEDETGHIAQKYFLHPLCLNCTGGESGPGFLTQVCTSSASLCYLKAKVFSGLISNKDTI